ncbi:MAG: TIGR00282 family metallophosphoesterase [Nitrospirae bacterium]|nr:TIGR00282 family metallophosphoesterase [Nitrospirota bacterium]
MNVLFIGDIVGKTGRMAVKALLPKLVETYKIDLTIANGENLAGGFGITEKTVTEMFGSGIHVITSGNHIWDKKEFLPYIAKENRVLRPLNYPPGVPGFGSVIQSLSSGIKVSVVNVSGRVFMSNMDCPFRVSEKEIERLRETTNIIVVDFHAEATSEKQAFGYFVDGKVSAVIGTHTHVQTADERLLPKGTAYISDVGMTGPADSIIGVQKEEVIERFLLQIPKKFEIAKGPALLQAVVIAIDTKTGRAESIQRLSLNYP